MEKSYLFVPGNRTDRVAKALHSNAEAVIIDLEDAVAVEEKEKVRNDVNKLLKDLSATKKKLYVRINDMNTPFWKKDVHVVASHPFLGVMLPKTNRAEEIRALEKELSNQAIIPLIETAKGILNAYEIASASSKVKRLAFGALDYCLDIGISHLQSEEALLFPRSTLVVASRAAGIKPPIDTVFSDFRDEKGLTMEAERVKSLGFYAKLCIHPKQVETINRIFSPTQSEIDWAEKVISAFERAEKKGLAAIDLDGTMIDYPVYRQALQIKERANTLS
ncbi:CoA ester lyase [Pueribacillus theae]|uniref:CoA ester lyase n=1 Tax=Pueribacillus theae TaxID=2171751 RepID=A0A2U1JSF6_9BACI|nr:CoA ester lyase [Pueribacillus theae]PWA08137.1 CoA ester lyase [Pueribacillus theae]